jgi:hypothetical protein
MFPLYFHYISRSSLLLRCSWQVEGIRQERQRDRQDLAGLLDIAHRDAGDVSLAQLWADVDVDVFRMW